MRMRPALDVLGFGGLVAEGMGYDVRRLGLNLLFWVSVLVALLTAMVGTIGFVGIIVPALLRQRGVERPSLLLPRCFWEGALLVLSAHGISQLFALYAEIKVGAITGLMGGIFFMFYMYRQAIHAERA
jgi:iron complex transport system permease protein